MSTSSQGLISLGHNNLKSNHDAMCVCVHRNKKDEFGENFHHH